MTILNELDRIPMDFVLSVGPACRPAQQLKHAQLRITACPMDWMQLYPLEAVTHSFETGFSDFFAEIEEVPTASQKKNRRVVDTKNDICSIHHFPTAKSLEQAQTEVRKTMLKRYRRIHKLLRKAKTICFVGNREESAEVLLQFMADFGAIYPQAKMFMVNMRHQDTDSIKAHKYTKDACTLYEASFCDEHPNGTDIAENPLAWHGNTPCWQEVFAHVHLSDATVKWAKNPLRKLFH